MKMEYHNKLTNRTIEVHRCVLRLVKKCKTQISTFLIVKLHFFFFGRIRQFKNYL